MLIGAHVSPAGGPAKAVERGAERGCDAIQIFNQNPRAWKPTAYSDEAVAAYEAALAGSAVQALLIHAVYLLNAASEDDDIRAKTLTSLTASLQAGGAWARSASSCTPGRRRRARSGRRSGGRARSSARRWPSRRAARCTWRTRRARAGRSGAPSASSPRCSTRPAAASASASASTAATSTPPATTCAPPRAWRGSSTTSTPRSGLGRLQSLHLNDSQVGLGSNRDRHAVVGQGELGDDGCAVFLSEPRFADLPCILETPDPDLEGTTEMERCAALRERGAAARRRG